MPYARFPKDIGLIASLILSFAVLWVIFSSISIQEVADAVMGAHRPAVAAFLVASFSSTFFRTWRYRTLLRSNGYETPFPGMYLIVLVRNTFSDLLPARLGTLMYVFLVRTRLGIPLDPAGASFALAFLFDIIALAPLIMLCVFLAGGQGEFSAPALLLGGAALFILSSTMILILPWGLNKGAQVLRALLPASSSWTVRLVELVSSVAARIEESRKAGAYARVFILSIFVRLFKYIGLYLFLFAMLYPRGYDLASLPFPKIFLGLCASELAASLPISGIAGFGAYQGAWIATFTLLGFPLDLATITSVGHHLFTQAYGYSLGAAAFLLVLLPLFKRAVITSATTNSVRFGSFGVFLLQVTVSFVSVSLLILLLLRSS